MDFKNKEVYSFTTNTNPLIHLKTIKDVKWSIIPFGRPDNRLRYYINENAEVYSVINVKNGGCLIIRVKERGDNKMGIRTIRLTIEGKNSKTLKVGQCVICSFILGTWADIPFMHKDGNFKNCNLNNLRIEEKTKICDTSNMYYFEKEYNKFEFVCKYLEISCELDSDATKDIAQEAFIYITTSSIRRNNVFNFLGLWLFVSRRSASEILRQRENTINSIDDDLSSLFKIKIQPKYFDYSLYGMVSNEKYSRMLRLYYEGYTAIEIMKMFGYKSEFGVFKAIQKATNELKQKLQKDINLYNKIA